MNTKDNKRKKASRERMQKAFIELLQTRDISKISVSDICKISCLNRSTFYANYLDVYDLADVIMKELVEDLKKVYETEWNSRTHSYDYTKLFCHIKDNQLFYKTFFKLDYDNSYRSDFYNMEVLEQHYGNNHLDYHIEFFKSGLTAMIKKWLQGGCKESPQEMTDILRAEYSGRSIQL